MVEFKQIIGRGTRFLKENIFLLLLILLDAHDLFKDDAWDGDPAEPTT